MLRGVNKQIIEINETENKIFERAVLYVRPEYAEMSESKLHSSANDFIKQISNSELWCVNPQEAEQDICVKKGSRAVAYSIVAALGIICAVLMVLLSVL